jgi:glutamine synthetase
MSQIEDFLKEHRIDEVECLLPDMSGIARGKILPAERFVKGLATNALRIPEQIFIQTVTGDYPLDDKVTDPATSDVYLVPDPETIRLVPWYQEPTAQVICDAFYFDGSPVVISARGLLHRILALYAERGWTPIVAPELEFFLVATNADPDYPLEPPVGRSGRRETGRQSYGVDAVNEFDPLFEDVYDFCEAQGIDIDTLTHEAGAAQMEMNFNHGPAMLLADQAFLFKRTVREAAFRHKVYATFMAKPMEREPGSSMHIHQSILETKDGRNLFTTKNGKDSKLFHNYIAGLQTGGHAAPGAQRELLPPADALFGRADQHPLGLRQPHRGLAGAPFRAGGPAGREPPGRCRRQPLSGDRRLPGLRLPGHDRETEAPDAGAGQRLPPGPHPAAHPIRCLEPLHRQPRHQGPLRRALHRGGDLGQGHRAARLPTGDLVLGTGASSAKRISASRR